MWNDNVEGPRAAPPRPRAPLADLAAAGPVPARPAPAPVVAVVLAGGDRGDSLAAAAGVTAKALLPLGGAPLGSYALRALRACGAVERIVYVGPTDGQLRGLYDTAVASGERLVDSLALGLGVALGAGAQRILVLSADIPWIDGAMIERFLADCDAAGPADIYYPVVRQGDYRSRFPDHERTFVKLRDDRFTGANLALLEATVVPALLPFLDRLFSARKNPLALAAIMGFDVLLSLPFGLAALTQLERRASALLGRNARVVIAADPELAADVDKPSHLPGVLDPERPAGIAEFDTSMLEGTGS